MKSHITTKIRISMIHIDQEEPPAAGAGAPAACNNIIIFILESY